MRTVDYSEILYGSAALAGFGKDDIGAPEFALFRTFHDRRLQMAWEIHRWPELCPVERRQYRPSYSATTTYTVATDPTADNSANEVFDVPTGVYYQSLQAGNTGNTPSSGGVENSAWWAACKNQYAATDWLANANYAVGDQVRNPATNYFYQCITAHTSGASFDAPKFGLLTPFNKVIAYTQPPSGGATITAIGEFFRAFDKDPRVTTQLRKFPFFLSPDGAQFSVEAPNVLWIYFRNRRPVLTGDMWDSTATYTSGNQVYFTATSGSAGNFYTANATTAAGESPATATAKWDVLEVPYFLRGYLLEGGYVDWLMSDGQADKSQALEAQATGYLELEADKVQRQQGQVARFNLN